MTTLEELINGLKNKDSLILNRQIISDIISKLIMMGLQTKQNGFMMIALINIM